MWWLHRKTRGTRILYHSSRNSIKTSVGLRIFLSGPRRLGRANLIEIIYLALSIWSNVKIQSRLLSKRLILTITKVVTSNGAIPWTRTKMTKYLRIFASKWPSDKQPPRERAPTWPRPPTSSRRPQPLPNHQSFRKSLKTCGASYPNTSTNFI